VREFTIEIWDTLLFSASFVVAMLVIDARLTVLSLLPVPLAMLLALGILYQHYGTLPLLQRALAGMIAVAAGLLLANTLSLAAALPRRLRPWGFLVLAFAGVGVMRWPLLYVMAALAPFAMAAVWRR